MSKEENIEVSVPKTPLERAIAANVANRALYKWVLEVLQNLMMIAAIFYLARQSGYWWLYAIVAVAVFALAAYCYTYVENVWFAYDIKSSGLRRAAVVIVGSVIVQSVLLGISGAIYLAIDKIVTIQVLSTKGP